MKLKTYDLRAQYTTFKDEWGLLDFANSSLFYDSNGISFASGTQSWLTLFINPFQSSVPEEEAIYDRKLFMAFFVKYFLATYPTLPDMQSKRAKLMASDYIQYIKNGNYKMKNKLKREFQVVQSEISNHFRALRRLEEEGRKLGKTISGLSRKEASFSAKNPQDKLHTIFQNFLKEERIIDMSYTDHGIEFYTGEIYIENYGKSYYIGKFKVNLNLDGEVRMENLDNPKDDIDHPHVSSRIPCLGTIKEAVPKMMFEGDFLGLFNLLHTFLTTYNEEGPYATLEKYWGTAEDWCERCDSPTLNCQCQTCPECDDYIGDCQCERCPRNSMLMGELDCSQCSYYTNDLDENDNQIPNTRLCRY